MRKYIFLLISVAMLACKGEQQKASEYASESIQVVILSTSDTHSQVEPFSAKASVDANMGGYARRMGVIEQEREQHENVFVFDSGDFSQGTPYFNFYRGRIEVDALNRMGYDAITLGNHEFDNGVDTLAAVLKDAKFEVVVSNYDVRGTALEGLVKPFAVLEKGGVRVGVIGLGVAPDDLIGKKNFEGVTYLAPLDIINQTAAMLREEEQCDLVVCLSHLGSDVPGVKGHEAEYDMNLIPQTHGVDIFLSGHTHHLHDERIADADGHEVILTQVGKGAARVGKITLDFQPKEK